MRNAFFYLNRNLNEVAPICAWCDSNVQQYNLIAIISWIGKKFFALDEQRNVIRPTKKCVSFWSIFWSGTPRVQHTSEWKLNALLFSLFSFFITDVINSRTMTTPKKYIKWRYDAQKLNWTWIRRKNWICKSLLCFFFGACNLIKLNGNKLNATRFFSLFYIEIKYHRMLEIFHFITCRFFNSLMFLNDVESKGICRFSWLLCQIDFFFQ